MKQKRLSLYLLCLSAVFVFGASTVVVSVTVREIEQDLGLAHAQMGRLALARGVCLVLMVMVSGFLASRYGKKLFLVLGCCILFVFGLLMSGCGSSTLLLPLFALLGAGLGSIEALVNPLVSELCPEREAPKLNELNAFFPLGMSVAALATGFFLHKGMDWRTPFLALLCQLIDFGVAS